MITLTRAIIGGLTVVVLTLGIALSVALAKGNSGTTGAMAGNMAGPGTGAAGMMSQTAGMDSTGMMSAMAGMDSAAMLAHMKEVLGEDGFNRMQQHFQAVGTDPAMTGMTATDQMMHKMMAGMMTGSPANPSMTPGPSDAHHASPTPSR